MTKREIALELTKLAYSDAVDENAVRKGDDVEKVVTDLYNYIFQNVDCEER